MNRYFIARWHGTFWDVRDSRTTVETLAAKAGKDIATGLFSFRPVAVCLSLTEAVVECNRLNGKQEAR